MSLHCMVVTVDNQDNHAEEVIFACTVLQFGKKSWKCVNYFPEITVNFPTEIFGL